MWPELFGHETARVLAMRTEPEDLGFVWLNGAEHVGHM